MEWILGGIAVLAIIGWALSVRVMSSEISDIQKMYESRFVQEQNRQYGVMKDLLDRIQAPKETVQSRQTAAEPAEVKYVGEGERDEPEVATP